MIRTAFLVVLGLHGLLHLLGFAKGFGLAELPQLTQPISRPWGVAWLAAGALTLATAALLPLAPRWWWAVGAVALVASQVVIVSSWSDARFGSLPNLLLLLAVAWGFAHQGPWSLPAEYRRHLAFASPARPGEVLTEADLAGLPDPVRRYVRAAGVVGQPRVHSFRATWTGRIRAGPDQPWMAFTADQLDTLDPPRRFFLMDAVMKGLPVDVLHVFDERGATMRVRLLSLKTMVDARGPVLTRSETVTLFNDLCVLAPGELVRPSVTWEPLDGRTARARYTLGANTIAATLHFNDAAELVDFSSDDRTPSPDGSTAAPTRWTTPARDHARVGPARVPRRAETWWHPASGAWSYGEFELQSLEYGTGR
ncbi:MAG: hypothetical protein IPQ24_21325 [Anaeromyxobacter sp.]|nr:hypothetical protein [Anaeromyxobacter sp.]